MPIPTEDKERCVAFHGHHCPGLTIGMLAARAALECLGSDADMVCIAETDSCTVDAIQVLTDCTLGKGNLILLDHGKNVFTFFDRDTGKGVRLAFDSSAMGPDLAEFRELAAKECSPEERARFEGLRRSVCDHVESRSAGSVFTMSAPRLPMPRPARILESLVCEACGEAAMESRTRRFGGKTLCLACFDAVEQKRLA